VIFGPGDSLTIDSICREGGCAKLGIQPRPMLAVLPTYLGIQSAPVFLSR
jgi:hypothetical protein